MPELSEHMTLLGQVARGLVAVGHNRTETTLGDRSSYVGLSDVGRAMTCMRTAVASKLAASAGHPELMLERSARDGNGDAIMAMLRRHLVLSRGHWFEHGVAEAFGALRSPLITQLEILSSKQAVPLRAHLDLTLARGGARPLVRVLEIKSTNTLPTTLIPAYEAQLHGQLGLLVENWNRPAFTYQSQPPETFPALCSRILGTKMPDDPTEVDIQGWVLCLSMTDARPFGPYRPHPAMLSLCRRTASELWTTVKSVRNGTLSLDQVATARGLEPFCQWCDHQSGCPRMAGDPIEDPDMDRDLAELLALKADRKAMDAEIREREAALKHLCGQSRDPAQYRHTPSYRFRLSTIRGRKTIEEDRLRSALLAVCDSEQAETIIGQASRYGAPFSRLSISAIPPTPSLSSPEPGDQPHDT